MIENPQDEYLETLYHLRERHQLDFEALREHVPELCEETFEGLIEDQLITVHGERIELTEEGFRKAEKIVRQHRLAERLLTDVLHMNPSEVEDSACEFEHIIADEIAESICILLGHPRTCPHGSPIPEGPCCRAFRKECTSLVVPLTEMPVGASARIAYVNSARDDRQHRLAHFGVVPGNQIRLHQRKPSIVVVLDSSRLAMEPSVAGDILVWKTWCDVPARDATPVPKPRRGFWRKRNGRSSRG